MVWEVSTRSHCLHRSASLFHTQQVNLPHWVTWASSKVVHHFLEFGRWKGSHLLCQVRVPMNFLRKWAPLMSLLSVREWSSTLSSHVIRNQGVGWKSSALLDYVLNREAGFKSNLLVQFEQVLSIEREGGMSMFFVIIKMENIVLFTLRNLEGALEKKKNELRGGD